VLIPEFFAGAILGRGNKSLMEIKEDCGCQLQFGKMPSPREGHRVLKIKGKDSDKAFMRVFQKMAETRKWQRYTLHFRVAHRVAMHFIGEKGKNICFCE